jgi:hypothetical protein
MCSLSRLTILSTKNRLIYLGYAQKFTGGAHRGGGKAMKAVGGLRERASRCGEGPAILFSVIAKLGPVVLRRTAV